MVAKRTGVGHVMKIQLGSFIEHDSPKKKRVRLVMMGLSCFLEWGETCEQRVIENSKSLKCQGVRPHEETVWDVKIDEGVLYIMEI